MHKETIPKKKWFWMTCWNNFFSLTGSLWTVLFPTPKWPFLANKEATAPCWRKRRHTATRWVWHQRARPWSVRRAFASWLLQLGKGKGHFRPTQNDPIWSKYIYKYRRKLHLPQKKPPQEDFFVKRRFSTTHPFFFSNGFFQEIIYSNPPPKTPTRGGPVPLAKHRLRSNPKP